MPRKLGNPERHRMNPEEKQMTFWRLAWPEGCLLLLVLLAGALTLAFQVWQGGGALFRMGEISTPSTIWDYIWVQGNYTGMSWWHGIGATFRDVFLILAVVIYIPLRGGYWFLVRLRRETR
jgi:hypothetical protein